MAHSRAMIPPHRQPPEATPSGSGPMTIALAVLACLLAALLAAAGPQPPSLWVSLAANEAVRLPEAPDPDSPTALLAGFTLGDWRRALSTVRQNDQAPSPRLACAAQAFLRAEDRRLELLERREASLAAAAAIVARFLERSPERFLGEAKP